MSQDVRLEFFLSKFKTTFLGKGARERLAAMGKFLLSGNLLVCGFFLKEEEGF